MDTSKEVAAPSVPMVLFVDCEADEDDDSLLYSYPKHGADLAQANKLKGLMLALHGLLDALSGQQLQQVVLHRLPQPHAAAHLKALIAAYKDTLLVILVPANMSDFTAQHVAAHITTMAFLINGSPDGWRDRLAVKDSPAEEQLEQRLDTFFHAAFIQAFGPDWLHHHVYSSLPLAVPYLHVALESQVALAELLTEVESAAAPVDERLLHPRRFHDFKTACLFHRGVVVQTHMRAWEQRLVWGFCRLHGLLQRTEEHPRVQLVQDVFLPPPPHSPAAPPAPPASAHDPAPQEGERRALLVVGLGGDLLCVLLEAEGGGAEAADLRHSHEVDAATAALYGLRDHPARVHAAMAAQMAAAGSGEGARAGAMHFVQYSGVSGLVLGSPAPWALGLRAPAHPGPGAAAASPPRPVPTSPSRPVPGSPSAGPATPSAGQPLGGPAPSTLHDFLATALLLRRTLLLFQGPAKAPVPARSPPSSTAASPARSPGGSTSFRRGSPTPLPSRGLDVKALSTALASTAAADPGAGRAEGSERRAKLRRASIRRSIMSTEVGSSFAAALAKAPGATAKRMSSGDSSLFVEHGEVEGLAGPAEMSVALQSRAGPGEGEGCVVTGRIDAQGREFYVCHAAAEGASCVELAFQLGFGVFA